MSLRSRSADMEVKRILFSDLDGTLLDHAKQIEPGTRALIDEMLRAGHCFAFCTGRPLASAREVARHYDLCRPGCYVIAYNGGVVYAPVEERVISYHTIPRDGVRRMFQLARQQGLYIQTYDRADTILACRESMELSFYTRHTRLPYKTGWHLADSLTEDPAKAILIDLTNQGELERFWQENAVWTDKIMNSFFSCEEYLEYCPLGVSKGAAVRVLCEALGIPLSDSVAVGDERNDIPMLQEVGTGAAVANAHPEALAAADYICSRDNNNGAVGEVIEKFILKY